MERNYTDNGFISKGSLLMVQDTDSKYMMLIPVVDMPETKSAPATVEKTVLSDGSVTETQGLQSNAQKAYTFNYHRDNLRALNKFAGKQIRFLEVNPDHTGERFIGTMAYGRSAMAVNGIVQGQIFITVNEADDYPLDDVRDITKKTAIINTPLNEVVLTPQGTHEMTIETTPSKATIKATSSADTIATASYADGKLTITGVAKGYAIVELEVSAEGEATSFRTIAVTVDEAE